MKSALAKKTYVMAVDPGLSGAVAVLGHGGMECRRDFGTLQNIAGAVRELLGQVNPDHILVELVGARPGQGVVSMFHFGESTGTGLGALFALRPDVWVERVAPLAWKNWYRKALGIPKGNEVDSREICLDLFPQWACYFKRKKDHNTADAVLMALWKLNHL